MIGSRLVFAENFNDGLTGGHVKFDLSSRRTVLPVFIIFTNIAVFVEKQHGRENKLTRIVTEREFKTVYNIEFSKRKESAMNTIQLQD